MARKKTTDAPPPRADAGRASPDRLTRALASVALAASLLALALAGYALYAQQKAEEDLRAIGRELQRALTPGALPMRGPPLELDPDDF